MNNKTPLAAALLAALAALPLAARADQAAPPSFSLLSPPGEAPLQRRGDDYAYRPRDEYRPQARQGLLLSLGAGGGSLYLSNEGEGRVGAADLDFKLGYGFSDHFQMFMDLNTDQGSNLDGVRVGSWSWTVRAQTVLIGDRAGNGLNVNFGVGVGGLTYRTTDIDRTSGASGLALAGGLSYDARLSRNFAISPELFVTWHQIPNSPAFADDVSSVYGVRLNLLWYLR